jgi:hypothetical protein
VGKVVEEAGNLRGMWVVGNAKTNGSFSATVQLLTAIANFSDVCAYATDYPPAGHYTAADRITFTGTPPFKLALHSGGTVSASQDAEGNYTYLITSGNVPDSFTDATGAPGTFTCATSDMPDKPTPTPQYAATTNTWTFGCQTTWSDRIVDQNPAECALTGTLSTQSPNPPAQYTVVGDRVYYNWTCAVANAAVWCQTPWKFPTSSDIQTLVNHPSSAGFALITAWGYGGYAGYESASAGYYWSSTPHESMDERAYLLHYYAAGSTGPDRRLYYYNKTLGFQVRCVKSPQ